MAQKDAELYFSVGGRIRQVLVKAGDQVQTGQVLAYMDNMDLDMQAKSGT